MSERSSSPGAHGAEEGASALDRVVFFSDAVFAIAITLLVLPLTEAELEKDRLPGQLLELWPRLFGFVLSFVVIGTYWIAHHRAFRYIRRVDEPLLGLNLIFLLSVALLPFPTKVLGEHGDSATAAIFYAASMAVTGMLSASLWFYASNGRRLVDAQLDGALIRYLRWRAVIAPLIFLPSIPVALVSPHAAEALWLLAYPAVMLLQHRYTTKGRSA